MSSTFIDPRSLRAALIAACVFAVMCAVPSSAALAQALNIADTPLFLSGGAEPLVMLALSNDEQLYRKAYTDFDDVDGILGIDATYKDSITYYGYFDSYKCYDYTGSDADGNFFPRAVISSTTNHYCDTVSNGRWSGNFLNWATMSRMDALRKVLYGGYRQVDSATSTLLERVYIPADNHAWTKLYSGSDLHRYTPYSSTTYPNGLTFCNVTPQGSSTNRSETNATTPRLRVARGAFTEWAAQESRQCLWVSEFTPADASASPTDSGGNPDKIREFTVRVKVCDSALLGKETCKLYGTSYKPVGLLQDFADADKLKMRFGLMTGSYGKRKSGGVLRKNTARMTNEVSAVDGTFTNTDGIIKSLNLMRISRYEYSAPGYSNASGDNCPFNQNTWPNGTCSNWGNPMSEMYLETLRYFAGKSANPDFASTDNPWIGGLKEAAWANPYTSTDATLNPGGKSPHCAKPSVIAISTGVVSFDNDQLSRATEIGLDVVAETDAVGAAEKIHGNEWYVGSLSGGSPNDECKSATVTALSAVTGICPQSAGLQGSFKMAGMAAFAHKQSTALQTLGDFKIKPVDTFAVALAPPTPTIRVTVGSRIITIIPAAYNVRNSNAMQLVNFRVISESADGKQGTYFMNYENSPSGSDYDNDMKGLLTYIVNGAGTSIKIIMHQTGSSAGATQKMGYIIDGVANAGTHYIMSNNNLLLATQQGGATFSTLTPAAINTACRNAGFALDPTSVDNELCYYAQAGSATPAPTPLRSYMRGVKTHTIGTPDTGVLFSPLYYAAKWGGYKDKNNNGALEDGEWDSDAPLGVPDTYFPVTNAGTLGDQLTKAFNEIVDRNATASAASVNSGSISTESRVFQARFNTSNWTGELIAYKVDVKTGLLVSDWVWNAGPEEKPGEVNEPLPAADLRTILTLNSGGQKIKFRWNDLDATRRQQLDDATVAPFDTTLQQNRLNYLRGDATNEGTGAGKFRVRPSKLGDIVNSSPIFVGAPAFNIRDSLESADPYSEFRSSKANRTPMVYVGANDGMLHAFDAKDGTELLAFVPGAVFPNLKQLSKTSYSHLFYVDGPPNVGDVYFGGDWHTVLVGGLNKGGKGIYALDVTNPADFKETNASSLILWEFTDTKAAPYGDPNLGYTYSQPAIVRLQNGKWAAVFGNGYNNTGSGRAVLYIVDIQTGARIAKLDTQKGTAAIPNGLSTPAVVDLNGDGIADYVYAGDLFGNLWKFDITNASSGNWKVSFEASGKPAPLFAAVDSLGNAQPIVSRPEVGRGPNGAGMIVLFGTGKYLEPTDKTVTSTPATSQRVQTFYGIIDTNTATTSYTPPTRLGTTPTLRKQTILYEQKQTFNGVDYVVRVPSATALGTARGWYIDLVQPDWHTDPLKGYQAERVVSNPILRNDRVIFSTLIPDTDACGFGGTSWLMELDALSGARLTLDPFDLTRDGSFGEADRAEIKGANNASTLHIIGGVQSGVGITAEPGILASGQAEFKYKFGTKGTGEMNIENPGPNAYGRQSWRQIR